MMNYTPDPHDTPDPYDTIYAACKYVKSFDATDNHGILWYHSSSDLQEQALVVMDTKWHSTIRMICSDDTLYKSLYLHKINTFALTSPDGRVWVFKRVRHPREEFNKWNRQTLCIHLKDIQRYRLRKNDIDFCSIFTLLTVVVGIAYAFVK